MHLFIQDVVRHLPARAQVQAERLKNEWQAMAGAPSGAEDPSHSTMDEIFQVMRCGDLRFEGPGHLVVGQSIGRATEDYQTLIAMAGELNAQIAPTTIVLPMLPSQVEEALRALEDGHFFISETWNGDHSRLSWVSIAARWHSAPEIYDLARILDRSVDCVLAQLPAPKPDKTLLFAGELLAWHRVCDEENDA